MNALTSGRSFSGGVARLRPDWFEAQCADACTHLSLAVARLLETDHQITLAHVREGLAILGEEERYQVTIADFYGAVERDYLIHGRKTLRNIKCVWKNHLQAAFGQLPAASLSSDQVIIYIAQRQADGAANATINRETSCLQRLFTLAIQTGKLTRKPYIPHLDERDNVRRGFVKDAQFDALARETGKIVWLRALLEIGFVFGFRKSELLKLRVRQFDLLERTITLEAGETKNGEGRQVELTDEAFDLLQECVAGKDQEAFVFTRTRESNGRRTKASDGHIVDFRDDWARACLAAGCPGLRFHDLRRSAVRNLIRAGVQQKIAQAISGHRTPSIFQRYNIVDQADLSDAARKLQNAATRRREQALVDQEPRSA
jgi:integrase